MDTVLLSRESASAHIRNALQILQQPDDDIDELDLAAVRGRLNKALLANELERCSVVEFDGSRHCYHHNVTWHTPFTDDDCPGALAEARTSGAPTR